LLESLTATHFVTTDRKALAARMDRACRLVFPLAFVVPVVVVFLR
jgi:hypothetical protein